MTAYQTMSARELDNKAIGQGVIIDVRTKMEHNEKHLGRAHAHVPLDELDPRDFMLRHGLGRDSDIYVLCRSGARAKQAAEKFIADGFSNVYVVDGGLMACEESGVAVQGQAAAAGMSAPQKSGGGVIPLERQVRIAAGLMAGLGALLGLVAHPVFTLIPLFVGGGLVFSGVTDRCGLALVLTKAPWNKSAVTGATCGTGACSMDKNKASTKTGSCS